MRVGIVYLSGRGSTFVRIPSIKSIGSTGHDSEPFRPNPDPSITVELSTYILPGLALISFDSTDL